MEILTIKLERNHETQAPSGTEGLKVPLLVLNELWEELLAKDKKCWGRVISDSMRPVIKPGEQVLVESVSADGVRFGDIIVFKRDEILVTHRALGMRKFREECCFVEKGDAVLQASLVPAKDVIGRVTMIKNSEKAIQTACGSGRLFQLTLGCISYISLQGWLLLNYCLTRGRRTTGRYWWGVAYSKSFSVLRRTLVWTFK